MDNGKLMWLHTKEQIMIDIAILKKKKKLPNRMYRGNIAASSEVVQIKTNEQKLRDGQALRAALHMWYRTLCNHPHYPMSTFIPKCIVCSVV